MEKSNFDKLLKRYVTDKVSHDEKVKIEAWLDVMKTESTDDLELSKEDGEELFRKITANKDNLKEIKAFKPTLKKSNGRWMIRFAASFMILSLLSLSLWIGFNYKDFTGEAKVDKLILDDGSIIWLKGESKLSYDVKLGGGRSTKLSGEGLFEVSKDPEHPFTIACGDAVIKVVGTSFNIRSSNDTLELKVLTGKVNVSTIADKDGIDVMPNEKIIMVGNQLPDKQTLTSTEISDWIDRTEYNMNFPEATLGDILSKLEKKFNVTIELKNKDIEVCRLAIDLTDRSLQSSLQLMSEIIDIDYQQNEGTIIIDGRGCK